MRRGRPTAESRNARRGLTLVEIVVALALLVGALLALFGAADHRIAAHTARASQAGHVFAALCEHYLALAPDALQAALDQGQPATHDFRQVAVGVLTPAPAAGAADDPELTALVAELSPRLYLRRVTHVAGHYGLDRVDLVLEFRDVSGPRWLRHAAVRRSQAALMALGFLRYAAPEDARSAESFHEAARALVNESGHGATARLDAESGLLVPAYPEMLRRFHPPVVGADPADDPALAPVPPAVSRLDEGYVRPRFAPNLGISH